MDGREKPWALNPVGVCSSLGIASVILWCKLMGHTAGFFAPLAGLGTWANARVFWLIGILACALACLALPRALHRMDALHRIVFPAVAVIGGACFALAFHQDLFDQRTFAVIGIIVSGFGYFWFISRFTLLLGLTQGIICLAWSFSCAFVLRQISLIVMDACMPVDQQVMVAIALPLVAIACLELACTLARHRDARLVPALAETGQASSAANSKHQESHTLWGIRTLPKTEHIERRSGHYLLVIVTVASLLLSVARACSISGTWGNDHTGGLDFPSAVPLVALYGAIIFLLVYLGIVRMANEHDISRFLVGVFLVIAGLLVGALQSEFVYTPKTALDVLVSANDPFALVFFWTTVATAVQTLSLRPNRVIGFAGTVYAAASIVWVFLINDANAVSSTFVLAAACIVFALFIAIFKLKEHDGTSTAVPVAADTASAPESAPLREISAPAANSIGSDEVLMTAIRERCEVISQKYALSPRESDVLLLLAQGRTGSAIQDELCVAASTVKTHTQHIYGKLGIGDRQELMDMVLGLR